MSISITKVYSLIIIGILLLSGILLYKGRSDLEAGSSVITQRVRKNTLQRDLPQQATTTELPDSSSTLKKQEVINTTSTTTITPSSIVMSHSSSTLHTEAIDVPLEKNFSATRMISDCNTPIKYKLGRFDNGFDISKKYFLDTANSATSLWNDVLGKDLFQYDEQALLTVNLIYDKRQADTKEGQYISAEIKNTESVAIALKAEYETLEITFGTLKDAYLNDVTTFNSDQKKYNDTVNEWNQKGGAPKDDYDALILEKERLQKVADSLKVKQDTLNSMLADINKRITRYNELVLFANNNVALSNKLARKKFTEGQYIPQTNEINIYQFTDDTKLKRVLAHEFGHALGLDHNKNKESIMYGINSGNGTTLSEDDIRDLKKLCSEN